MPTYEYLCPEGHEFELFQKMSDKPRAKCPACGKPATRKISGGAGLHFKGSGFYITDYGKDGKGPRKEPAATESTTPAPAAPAADAKAPAADAKTPATPKPEAPAPAPTASKSARKKGHR
jgi:putative FmdB family regulatory protein